MKTIALEACTLTFVEEHIVHAHFHDGIIAGPDAVDTMFHTIAEEHPDGKVLLMVSVGQGASLTNEARAHASGDAGSGIIAADAIIVRDFGHQMSANAFVRHNKPKRPIQLFPDAEMALSWLREQKHLLT